MGELSDRILIRFGAPDALRAFLSAPGAGGARPVEALLGLAFDFPFARVHAVGEVTVGRVEVQSPVGVTARARGSWVQTAPSYARTEASFEGGGREPRVWLDLAADVGVEVTLQVDPAGVDSFTALRLDDVETFDDLRARVPSLDVEEFKRRHRVATLAELKARAGLLLGEVRFRQPGPFDPGAPGNQFRVRFGLAGLVRESLSVAEALRDVRRASAGLSADGGAAGPTAVPGAEVRSPFAPALFFPDSVLGAAPFDGPTLARFFLAQGVVALFTPTT